MTDERIESIEAEDGGTFEVRVLAPARGRGHGVVVLSDIYGFDRSTAAACDQLTGLGYVAVVPDLFWRPAGQQDLEPEVSGLVSDSHAAAGARWDRELGLSDLGLVLRRAHQLPEVEGAVGVVGFGFGGTQSICMAAEFGPACTIAYQAPDLVDNGASLERIHRPTMLHFWRDDPAIPASDLERIRIEAKANNQIIVHVHPGAGPGFDPLVAEREQAMGAWSETASFLYLHLGGPGLGA